MAVGEEGGREGEGGGGRVSEEERREEEEVQEGKTGSSSHSPSFTHVACEVVVLLCLFCFSSFAFVVVVVDSFFF